MIERIYNIPLRKKCVKTQEYRRAKKAITIIREFIEKHMKSNDVIISKEVNELVWSKGIKHVPGSVKVKVVKEDNGKVRVSLEK